MTIHVTPSQFRQLGELAAQVEMVSDLYTRETLWIHGVARILDIDAGPLLRTGPHAIVVDWNAESHPL